MNSRESPRKIRGKAVNSRDRAQTLPRYLSNNCIGFVVWHDKACCAAAAGAFSGWACHRTELPPCRAVQRGKRAPSFRWRAIVNRRKSGHSSCRMRWRWFPPLADRLLFLLLVRAGIDVFTPSGKLLAASDQTRS